MWVSPHSRGLADLAEVLQSEAFADLIGDIEHCDQAAHQFLALYCEGTHCPERVLKEIDLNRFTIRTNRTPTSGYVVVTIEERDEEIYPSNVEQVDE